MATDVPMPKLGLTMEEATIIEWLVPDGSDVVADMPVLLIRTDKTETEVVSPGPGRLHQIGRPEETFECGERIAMLLEADEEPPTVAAVPSAPAATASSAVAAPREAAATTNGRGGAGGRRFVSPNARRIAAERGIDLALVRGTGPGARIVSEDVLEAPAAAPSPSPSSVAAPVATVTPAGTRTSATIAARQLADLLGIDLDTVAPDPHQQRVTRETVAVHVRTLLAGARRPDPSPDPMPAPAAPLLQDPTEVVPLTGMRGTIAKRMHASLASMAQLTLAMDADLAAVVEDRATRKERHGAAPSYTDYVVAATARALRHHPRMNAQITDDGIAQLPEVHVGLAVAVDDGLLVPVIRDAADRTLEDLAAESARLAAAARSGRISPAELEGGTFSVSTLGMFGVDMFTPIVNSPNVGILGVGRLRDELVLDEGEVTSTPRLTLSLTWDHRALDGAPAAEFARTIADLLASPADL